MNEADKGKTTLAEGMRATATDLAACYPAPSVEELIRRQRHYLEEIQPFIKVQADIMAIQPFTLYKNGVNGYDRRINWLPGSKETFDMAALCIEEISRKIFQVG